MKDQANFQAHLVKEAIKGIKTQAYMAIIKQRSTCEKSELTHI
jgi:hypothetical protein